MLKYSVGLDISSKKIDCCISVIDINQKVTVKSSTVISNDLKGFKTLDNWIIKHHKEKVIPLIAVMKLINLYVNRFDVQYLKVQKFLNPYPSELALRSDVKAYK